MPSPLTITEYAALGGLACNIILTALALWRSCQSRHHIKAIAEKLNVKV